MFQRSALLLAAALVASAARADDLASDVHLEEPRAFGHFIGDEVARKATITVPPQYVLDPASLPKQRRVTRYLEVIGSHVSSQPASGGLRYHIELDYQIVNSPEAQEMVMLPGLELHFTAAAAPEAAFDTPWQAAPVLIAPLAAKETRAGLEQLRPSRLPRTIDTARHRTLLTCFAAAAVLLSLPALTHLYARAGHGARSAPFARAHRRLRELAALAAGRERLRDAYRTLHRAFDETAQARLFANQLPAFVAANPRFAPLAPSMQQFFEASRAEFFAAATGESFGLEAVLTLCAELRDREAAVVGA